MPPLVCLSLCKASTRLRRHNPPTGPTTTMKPSESSKKIVAAVHAAPVFMNKEATIDKTVGLIEKAGKEGINLLVFPELFVPGYPYFMMCYPPLDTSAANAAYADASVEVPGPEISRVQAAARRASVAVVLGISERLTGTRTCFISQVFIDDDGSLLGVHRKLQPTYMERMVFGQGGGATLKVYDTSVGRVGGLCCWEHTMNSARQEMIVLGEQIHAASWPSLSNFKTGDDGDAALVNNSQIESLMKAHAMTAQVFVVAAGLTVDKTCMDWMEANFGPQKHITLGGGWSAIIHPYTHFVAGPHVGPEERFVTAEINLDDIKTLKCWVDGAGHYSRPEILRHQVDRRPIWHDESASVGSPSPAAIPDGEQDQQCS